LLDTHDMLRARVTEQGTLVVGEKGSVDAAALITRVPAGNADPDETAERAAREAAGRLDPSAGVLVRVVWVDRGPGQDGRLAMVVHHLAVDGVSWRVLVSDLRVAGEAAVAGRAPELDPVGASFRGWAKALAAQAVGAGRVAELEGWVALVDGPDPRIGKRPLDPVRDTAASMRRRSWTVPVEQAATLVGRVPAAFHCGVHEVLLASLAAAVAFWRGEPGVLVDVEGHGRVPVGGVDLSRVVGWFTSVHPVRLDVSGVDLSEALRGGAAAGWVLKAAKEQVRAVPGDGLGYGLLRYLNPDTGPVLAALPGPQIGFNYLGRFTGGDTVEPWQLAGGLGASMDPDMPAVHALEAGAIVRDTPGGSELTVSLTWPDGVLDESAPDDFGQAWLGMLAGLAAHVDDPAAGGHTPSDFSLLELAQDEVEELEAEFGDGLSL
jgi:mycobactin peptide synthetase MbtF